MTDWTPTTMKKVTEDCSFETGIRGETVFIRTKIEESEAYSELTMTPETARYIGDKLIAMANIIQRKVD